QRAGGEFHQRVTQADAGAAARALAAQEKITQQRDVLVPADLMVALLAARARHHQVEGLFLRRRLARHLGALRGPLGLQHLREAVDHHVEKAAQEQADHTAEHGGNPLRYQHHPTTAPNLKIGRYIDTTMPPMMTPSTTMMMGSIRLDRPATISSTSAS